MLLIFKIQTHKKPVDLLVNIVIILKLLITVLINRREYMKFNFKPIFLCSSIIVSSSCLCMEQKSTQSSQQQQTADQGLQSRALSVMAQNGRNVVNQLYPELANWLAVQYRQHHTPDVVPQLRVQRDQHRNISCAALHPNGTMLAIGTHDGPISLCGLNGQETNPPLIGHVRPANHGPAVDQLAFNANGCVLASSNYETIKLWNLENNKSQTVSIYGVWDGPRMVWSPDGSLLAVRDAQCHIGDRSDIIFLDQEGQKTAGDYSFFEDRHTHSSCMAWNHDSTTIAVGAYDGVVTLIDREGNQIRNIHVAGDADHHVAISCLAWTPDNSLLAVATTDCRIHLMDLTGTCIKSFNIGNYVFATSLSWNHDGTILAAVTKSILSCTSEERNGSIYTVCKYNADAPREVCFWNRDGSKMGKINLNEVNHNFLASWFINNFSNPSCGEASSTSRLHDNPWIKDERNEMILSSISSRDNPPVCSWSRNNSLEVFDDGRRCLWSMAVTFEPLQQAFNQLNLNQIILLNHIFTFSQHNHRMRLTGNASRNLFNSLPQIIKDLVRPYVEIVYPITDYSKYETFA